MIHLPITYNKNESNPLVESPEVEGGSVLGSAIGSS